MMLRNEDYGDEREVTLPLGALTLEGTLGVPARVRGVVLFAHGSGSSRFSPRNRFVARVLREAGLGTLLLDLLSREEENVDNVTRELRFDIGLLADRLVASIDWLDREPTTRGVPIGLFGASTGGGAALVAAAERPERVAAVVSRGGRPDLAGDALPQVRAPTLLLVGERDDVVISLNESAKAKMRGVAQLAVIPGATHLFEEAGALEQVANAAREWFLVYLAREHQPRSEEKVRGVVNAREERRP
jgi:putative phosphoribosyl transferase